MVHPGKHLRPVERVLSLLLNIVVGPSIRSVSVDCHLASCYRSAFGSKKGPRTKPSIFQTCAELGHGVNVDAAVLVDKRIDGKLVHIFHKILVTAGGSLKCCQFHV